MVHVHDRVRSSGRVAFEDRFHRLHDRDRLPVGDEIAEIELAD